MKNTAAIIVLSALWTIIPAFVRADVMTLDYTYTGTNPVGSSPWVEIIATQMNEKTVQITVNVPSQDLDSSQSEFIDKVYLNVAPTIDPSLLTIAYVSGVQYVASGHGENAYHAIGDGYYDILIDYEQANNSPHRLTTGTSSTFTIASKSLLSVDSFNALSESGGGGKAFYAVAHVQGIPLKNSSASGCVGARGVYSTPEPSTLVLLGMGAFGLMLFARRKQP